MSSVGLNRVIDSCNSIDGGRESQIGRAVVEGL